MLRSESDVFVGRRERVERTLVCSMQGYFPVAVRTGPSSLAAVFRTGGPHIGVSGTLAVSSSTDAGRSWSDPVDVAPRGEDVRNPAFGLSAAGKLVLLFQKARPHHYRDGEFGPERDNSEEARKRQREIEELFSTSSADCGRSWSAPVPVRTSELTFVSPYGRIVSDESGTLYACVYGRARTPREGIRDTSVLLRSRDGGESWTEESVVAQGYNEISFAFVGERLVAALRSESGHTAIAHSSDLGVSWSAPVQLTRDGEHPADLTLLSSGTLLFTFGRRIRPYGCGALLSPDGGRTWDREHEVLLASDGIQNTDLGYPSTVQMADGTIVTLLYYASGSEAGERRRAGWGEVSCQAIRYREEQIR